MGVPVCEASVSTRLNVSRLAGLPFVSLPRRTKPRVFVTSTSRYLSQ